MPALPYHSVNSFLQTETGRRVLLQANLQRSQTDASSGWLMLALAVNPYSKGPYQLVEPSLVYACLSRLIFHLTLVAVASHVTFLSALGACVRTRRNFGTHTIAGGLRAPPRL